MRNKRLVLLIQLSLLTALSVVFGNVIKIPTPTGFLTLLDAGVFFTTFYYGAKEGAIVGGLSGFLIDLLAGYPSWMLWSLVAHGGQGYFAGWKGKKLIFGLVLSTLLMIGIYAIGSGFMYGWESALPGIPSNLGQNFLGMIVGYLAAQAVKRIQK